jgi:cell division protein FtsL
MTRINFMLLLVVLCTAFYLVRVQYESRRLTTELERANIDARKIEIEQRRLDLESRSQATPLRVEKIAREQLNMRTVSPATTIYLGEPAVTGARP